MKQFSISILFAFSLLAVSDLSAQRSTEPDKEESTESYGTTRKTEIKINPIALLFEGFQGELEVAVRNNVGVGVHLIAGSEVLIVSGRLKYYLSHKRGWDRFFLGTQLGFASIDDDSGIGFGFDLGYKLVSKDYITVEASAGVARATESVSYTHLTLPTTPYV